MIRGTLGDLGPGDHIGRYVIEGLLGEGGMGHVYRAFDATLNRRVAIKLLRTDAIEPVDSAGVTVPSAARVVREARMAAALDHPNVVAIFDVGEADGRPFIVMELVNGRSLRACIGKGEIPMLERVHWLVGVGRGLAAAHKAGLVHRDVKPENVLVRADGLVKVLDFGIARLARVPSQRPPPMEAPAPAGLAATATTLEKSTLAGTPAYMAPEQIRCEHVDARVDQFAWGVVAYELLTGKTPWRIAASENVSLLMAVLEQTPAPLSAASLGVSEPFAAAVMRALSKRREDRFASIDELLLATGAAWSQSDASGSFPSFPPLADTSSQIEVSDISQAPTLLATNSAGALAAAVATGMERRRQSRRRRRALAAGGLVLGVAAVSAITWRSLHPRRTASDRVDVLAPVPAPPSPARFHPRDPRRLTFDQGCEEYPSLSPDAASVAFDSASGDDIQVVVLDIASGAQRRITSGAGWHFSPAVSPDGRTIAYLRQHDDEVGTWLAPFDGSSPPRLLATGRARPSWTPDGKAIWAGPANRPQRVDVASGEPTRAIDPPPGFYVVRARELADGRVVGRLLDRETKRGHGLVIYAVGASTSVPFFTDETEDAIGVAPDGSLFVPKALVPTDHVELWQVPIDGRPPSAVQTNIVLPTKGIDFARDGSVVVWSTCSTEQDIASIGAGDRPQASPLFPKTEWSDEQPAGIPGATSLVVVSDRAERRQLWVLDTSGKAAARRLAIGDVDVSAPSVSPDGKWVAFTVIGAGIHVAPIDGSSASRRLTSGSDDTRASFARDGASVYFETATASRHRAIARVPTAPGAVPAIVIDDAERPAASPADDWVAYVAMEGEQGTPTILDGATRRGRRLSPALGKGSYGALHFSPDGKRVVVSVGLSELVEVDARSGAVVRRFASGDQITSVTYLGKELVVSRQGWRGDVWLARDAW